MPPILIRRPAMSRPGQTGRRAARLRCRLPGLGSPLARLPLPLGTGRSNSRNSNRRSPLRRSSHFANQGGNLPFLQYGLRRIPPVLKGVLIALRRPRRWAAVHPAASARHCWGLARLLAAGFRHRTAGLCASAIFSSYAERPVVSWADGYQRSLSEVCIFLLTQRRFDFFRPQI